MYAIKNTVQLVGNVTEHPVIRETGDGKKYARFSISIEDAYNNGKGLRVKETQSHALVAYGKVAALVEKYLEKDMTVAILGRLVNRLFRDSKGANRSITEVQVNELLILDMQVHDDREEYITMAV